MQPTSSTRLSAALRVQCLMRRIVLSLFASGVLSILVVWHVEVVDGTLSAFNRVAYPTMVALFLGCYFVLLRFPGTLAAMRWIGFVATTGTALCGLWAQVGSAEPLEGNYNALTLLNWLPLCYAMAFLMLARRQALGMAGLILGIYGACTVRRALMGGAGHDLSMLGNAFLAQAVLIICLSGTLWLRDVVRRQEEEASRLMLLAGTDPLTGLANRRWTLLELEQAAQHHGGESEAAVLIADIDHFKRINDSHGHDTGDQVLVAVAEAIRATMRKSDVVARWGGEEFLVLMPGAPRSVASDIAERLRMSIASLSIPVSPDLTLAVTVSIGVAQLAPRETGHAWLKRADEALYRAKAAGRNQCAWSPA